MPTADEIIRLLQLQPLTFEGGFFRETYRSKIELARDCLPPIYTSGKSCSTAIYYLLTHETVSRLHRLPTDEIYHFYLGDPVELVLLVPGARWRTVTLGQDIMAGQKVQALVPGGVWQGAYLKEGGRWALLGTTMAPGFDRSDFLPADPDEMLGGWPAAAVHIRRLLP